MMGMVSTQFAFDGRSYLNRSIYQRDTLRRNRRVDGIYDLYELVVKYSLKLGTIYL